MKIVSETMKQAKQAQSQKQQQQQQQLALLQKQQQTQNQEYPQQSAIQSQPPSVHQSNILNQAHVSLTIFFRDFLMII